MSVSASTTAIGSLRPATNPLPTARTVRAWAVVEIRDDGTLGAAEVVSATGTRAAAMLARSAVGAHPDRPDLSAELKHRLALVQAAGGHLHEAHRTLTEAAGLSTDEHQHRGCVSTLAVVEAFLGRLGRATSLAEEVLASADVRATAAADAHLAMAWVHLQRAEFTESEHCLASTGVGSGRSPGPWLETLRVLAEAQLLTATCRSDAAVGVLAAGARSPGANGTGGWIPGVLVAARADALLASGEPHRALAAVTPLPRRTAVEAGLAAAAARRGIGDVRGAGAVMQTVAPDLEAASLAAQVRARLLEARLADESGDRRRSWHLIDRALRSAAEEDMRMPLRHDWRWLRAFLDREPHLMHRHRAFVLGREPQGVPRTRQADLPPGAALTHRECEVLELLAQMYSTEEIARTLYVSSNTVKTHVKGIFGKLAVNRRSDAVRRGRALGLC